ncbi:PREDICTED: uncharacterized protein LOC109132517, partial [Camelina sativa]|uniref:Uncharacterized protein LOC109132517 n=1 Tax=Camelina sativa TaxID=90675 RepID=A0ABM1RL16_CAMSA
LSLSIFSTSFITNLQLNLSLSLSLLTFSPKIFDLITKKKPAIDRKTFPPPHTPSPGVVRRLHAPPSSSSSSTSLLKQHSWSPDLIREEAWSKRQDVSRRHRYLRRGKSLTDEDLDELKASFELGFGFGSPEMADQRLSDTLPALELYFAVQKSYNDAVSNKSTTTSSSSLSSDGDTSPHNSVYRNSDDPQTVKTKLKQWARVVACTVNQSPPR